MATLIGDGRQSCSRVVRTRQQRGNSQVIVLAIAALILTLLSLGH